MGWEINVYIYISYQGPSSTDFSYPGVGSSANKFSDERGSSENGNLIYFIRNDDETSHQFDWFMLENSSGLTQAGMSKIKSIN